MYPDRYSIPQVCRIRVDPHPAGSFEPLKGLDNRLHLHSVVGSLDLEAGNLLFGSLKALNSGPSAWSRVARTRAVSIDVYNLEGRSAS